VVTEYGIAYLHGKNIRERAMDLIAIAHPKFRPWLLEEAKKRMFVYSDQALVSGDVGIYPESLETWKITKTGLDILLRPAKISDESLLKDFFYGLSDDSKYLRFFSQRKDMPHTRLQEYEVLDYTKRMVILAILAKTEREDVIGLGQYDVNEDTHYAEVAVVVKDEFQSHGVGTELLSYLTFLAKRQGILGFTAEVLAENSQMLRILEKLGFQVEKRTDDGDYELRQRFSI